MPPAVGDAAGIDGEGRMLLIQRADDSMWTMPNAYFDL